MRTMQLNRREARTLRDTLTTNAEGYDFLDLCRLDHLAKKLTELQGEYAQRIAELNREEKRIRRTLAKAGGQQEIDAATRLLDALSFEVADLNEEAETVAVEFVVEDGDYRLINDKLERVTHWLGLDDLRHVIIGMVQAVKSAERTVSDDHQEEIRELKPLRRK